MIGALLQGFKGIRYLLAAGFGLFAMVIPTSATHLAGGTVTVRCTGAPNTYQINILRYKDCDPGSAGLPASFTLNIRGVAPGSNVITVTMNRVNIDTLPNNAALTPCQQVVGSLCIERHRYESQPVVLQPSPGGYDLYFSECCRNQGVINLQNSSSLNQTTWTRIPDPGKFPCNSSPTFLVPPPLEVCMDDEFVSDNSVVDADGGIVPSTMNIIAGPHRGSASNIGSGTIRYIPDSGFTGVDTIRYVICDDHYPVECDTGYIFIVVKPSNLPPFLGDDKSAGPVNQPMSVDVLLNDSDPEGNWDLSTLAAIQGPSNGALNIVPPGFFEYQPNSGFAGIDTVWYTICDTGYPAHCDTAIITYHVSSGVVPPTANHDYDSTDNNTVINRDVLNNDVANSFGIDVNSLAIIGGPSNGIASVTGSIVSYTPAVGFTAVDSVIYQVCDTGPTPTCDTAIFRIVVTPLNQRPYIHDDRFYMYDIVQKDFPVLANDVDVDGAIDPSTVAIVTGAANGTVSVNPNGTVNYAPNSGFLGVDTFSYRACDDHTPPDCDTAIVHVTVQDEANIPPIAYLDFGTVGDFDTLQIDILQNDYDPDKDSFVFYLCDALDGTAYQQGNIPPFTAVPYVSPYSGINPIPSNPPVYIDPNTGILIGTPTATGVYILKICMDEYRDGKLIGTYNRETEVNVVNCTYNTVASITPTDPQVPGVIQNCGDTTVQFLNASMGASGYFWDFGDPTTNQDTSSLLDPVWIYSDTGVYTVTLIANPGWPCADTTTAEVRIYPGVLANFGHTLTTCIGAPITFMDSSVALAGTISGWTWNFGDGTSDTIQNPTHTYNVLGNYPVTLIAESDVGCKDTITQNVQVYGLPAVSAGQNKNICVGDSAQLQGSGTGLSYQWKPATGLSCTTCLNPKASPGQLTVYTLIATGPGGCMDSTTVVVNVSPKPIVDAGPDKYVCGTQSTQINATVSSSTGYFVNWNPTTGLNPPNILTPQAAPGVTTTYTLTITATTGCTVRDSMTVYVSNLSFTAGADTTICAGDTAQLNGALSAPNLVFSWAPANLVSDPNILNPKALPTASQLYTLRVTDTLANCSDEDTVRVRLSDGPPLSAGSDTTICINSSVTLQASGGTSYIWDADPTLSCLSCASPVAAPSVTTEYFVTSMDTFGCTARDSIMVTVVPLPTVTISPDTIICPGDPVDLFATGGISYQWMPSAGLGCDTCSTTTAQPGTATTYTVEVMDVNGCQNSAQVAVTFRNKPNITISPDQEICLNDTVQIAASGGTAYLWSPSAGLSAANIPDPLASPSITTRYTVRVTDAFGCWNRDSVEVKVNVLQPGNFIGDTSLCQGGSVTLFANGFNSYQWSPASSLSCDTCPSPTATPTMNTTYTIFVEDALGCADTGYVDVTVNPLPTILLTSDTTVCEGFVVPLQASGGTTYQWSPSQGLSCTSCATPSALPGSSTRYKVTVTDNKGCIDTSSVGITVLPAPPVSAGSDTTICLGDSTVLGATGAAFYQWIPASGLSCTNCPNPMASPSTTVDYRLIGTHSNGCQRYDTVTVLVNPLPTASVSPTNPLICDGDSVQLQASGGITYQWLPTTDLSCTNCANPYVFPIVNTGYTVRVSNQFGCWDEVMAEVDVTSAASANVTPDTGVCPMGSIQLFASGGPGATYTWAPNIDMSGANTATPIVTPTQAREYTVTIIDQNNCEVVVPVFIDIYTPAEPHAGTDTTICFGDSAPLTAENGISYQWEPASGVNDATRADPLATPSNSTEFTVTITDINGCIGVDSVFITVIPLPNIDAGTDQTVYEGKPAYLAATGGVSYVWSPSSYFVDTSDATITVLPQDTITYSVIGTDAQGCRNMDSVTIYVIPNAQVYVPSGFTPNGDGRNDRFRIYHPQNFNLISLRVYDRWGNLLFETSDPLGGWDGKAPEGGPMPIGAYIYILEGVDELGKSVVRKGNITLLR